MSITQPKSLILLFGMLTLLMSLSVNACQQSPASDPGNHIEEVENPEAFWAVPFEETSQGRMVIMVYQKQFWAPDVSMQEIFDTIISSLVILIDDIKIEEISISVFNIYGGAITDENGDIIGRYGPPIEIGFSIQYLTTGQHQVTIKARGPSGVYQYESWDLACEDVCVFTEN